MARCTAPVLGHRSSSAAAHCPACGSRYGRYGGNSSYGSYSSSSYSSSGRSGDGRSSSGGSGSSASPRWSPAGSSVAYTPAEVRALTPVRSSVENLAKLPDLRDVFLCHAWDDRQGAQNAGELLDRTLRELVLPEVAHAERLLEEAREASSAASSAAGEPYDARVGGAIWPTGLAALLPHLREYLKAGARAEAEERQREQAAAELEARRQRERESEQAAAEYRAIPVEVRNRQELLRLGMLTARQ